MTGAGTKGPHAPRCASSLPPEGGVACLGAARRQARSCRKVVGKTLRVDRGRGHDDLQVRAARQNLAQVAEQEVDVQAALVRFIDDDGVVGLEQRVGLRLGQQDAVGHELDRGVAAETVLEAHLVAHHITERSLEFLRNALGHRTRGDAARLRVTDELAATRRVIELAASHGQRNFRQLCGLAGTGLAAHDDDLMLLQGGADFVAFLRHRQRWWKFDFQGAGRQGGNFSQNQGHKLGTGRLSPHAFLLAAHLPPLI